MKPVIGSARWAAIVRLLAVLSVVLGCVACGDKPQPGDRSLETIRQAGKMRVGYVDAEPAAYKDPASGRLHGVFVDMVEEIAASAGIAIEWVNTEATHYPDDLAAGKFDFGVGPVPMTVPDALKVAFTHPVAYTGHCGAVRKDAAFIPKKRDDLKKPGLRIAVLRGRSIEIYARESFPDARLMVIPGDNPVAPLASMAAGEADVALADAATVIKYVAGDSNLSVVLNADDQQMDLTPIAWFTRPEDARLREFLDSSIAFYRTGDRLRRFQQPYPTHLLYDPAGPR